MESFERLIPTINKLQDVISLIGRPQILSLPQIVVVGSQSSGKSSVLESLVGKDFLPRGSGIVTRRPLILQLVHIEEKGEWGEFLHKPTIKYTDFRTVLAEIEMSTRKLVGDKGISSDPINLKIFSNKVLDITLVDLPGLTKVAVEGQPQDIDIQIRNMILSFIENPETIILAISCANADIANSESLKIAREVDPEGNRTLGVLTKIDLMDRGTDARDILSGKVYPLKLGYIGVICRSQKDINDKKSIEKHLGDEKQYFKHNSIYAPYADKLGMPCLALKLNTLLIKHIKESLPKLKENITKMLRASREELKSYGEGFDGDLDKMSAMILTVLENYSKLFREALEGSIENFKDVSMGAKIKEILFSQFRGSLKNIEPLKDLSDDLISAAITNATGIRSSLFIPEQAFEMLIKKTITKMREPSVNCLHQVLDVLKEINGIIHIKEFEVYPNLARTIIQVTEDMLGRFARPAQYMIESIFKVELNYINIEHPDFIGGSRAISEDTIDKDEVEENVDNLFFIDKDAPSIQSDSLVRARTSEVSNKRDDKKNLKIIKKLIESYYKIVKKNIEDIVPKAIIGFLVNKAKFKIHTELVTNIYKEEKIIDLMIEPGDIPEKRKRCKELLRSLERADAIINEVKHFT